MLGVTVFLIGYSSMAGFRTKGLLFFCVLLGLAPSALGDVSSIISENIADNIFKPKLKIQNDSGVVSVLNFGTS